MTVYHQCIMKLPNYGKIISQAVLTDGFGEKRVVLHMLQPLWWCCVDCVIYHERDVHEE